VIKKNFKFNTSQFTKLCHYKITTQNLPSPQTSPPVGWGHPFPIRHPFGASSTQIWARVDATGTFCCRHVMFRKLILLFLIYIFICILNYLCLCVRIFPLCVPRLSQSAEDHLIQLVHCYLSTSSANHRADDDEIDQSAAMYDVRSLEYNDTRLDNDDDADVVRQLDQGPWTLDNGEWRKYTRDL